MHKRTIFPYPDRRNPPLLLVSLRMATCSPPLTGITASNSSATIPAASFASLSDTHVPPGLLSFTPGAHAYWRLAASGARSGYGTRSRATAYTEPPSTFPSSPSPSTRARPAHRSSRSPPSTAFGFGPIKPAHGPTTSGKPSASSGASASPHPRAGTSWSALATTPGPHQQ